MIGEQEHIPMAWLDIKDTLVLIRPGPCYRRSQFRKAGRDKNMDTRIDCHVVVGFVY